ncbi:hypothetical protein BDN71DRAFT_1430849 [Pleurotus eryngii]|uniref:Uncharacterized protein n=1 Tax=Pleurotus eryngii TaxID=5323 RepID=A0A9P6A0G9_PLEER|nr:hypothetical protein BDN71DRAFT_1430849 [Pleurotus eryngii]
MAPHPTTQTCQHGHAESGVAGMTEGETFQAIERALRQPRERKYKEFLAETTNIPAETSTCSNYDAVKSASIHGGKCVMASGVGTIECSWHDMKHPLSVGDLQLGEKYANMDYLYFSSITNHSLVSCIVSYDIACQWKRNMGNCAAIYPSDAVRPHFHELTIKYLVLKFHLQRVPQVQIQEAIQMCSKHVPAFLEFSQSLPADTITAFSKMVWEWEAGESMTNPYETKLATESMSKVCLALAQEDAAAIAQDEALNMHTTISPSVLIHQGIELEDQQTQLANNAKALGVSVTKYQHSQLIEQHSCLQCRIMAWCQVQALYMPGVVGIQTAAASESSSALAEMINLLLHFHIITSTPCDLKLARYKWCQCYVLVFDCLAKLRRHLLVLNTMYQLKNSLICNQHHNMWSNTLIHRVQSHIKYISNKYYSC